MEPAGPFPCSSPSFFSRESRTPEQQVVPKRVLPSLTGLRGGSPYPLRLFPMECLCQKPGETALRRPESLSSARSGLFTAHEKDPNVRVHISPSHLRHSRCRTRVKHRPYRTHGRRALGVMFLTIPEYIMFSAYCGFKGAGGPRKSW